MLYLQKYTLHLVTSPYRTLSTKIKQLKGVRAAYTKYIFINPSPCAKNTCCNKFHSREHIHQKSLHTDLNLPENTLYSHI